MIFKIGKGTLTVKGAKNQELTVGGAIYCNNLVYDLAKTEMTLGSAFTGTLEAADYASTVKKIDAATVTKPVQIVGNLLDNTIIGGAGNDTLTGGDGSDVFVYTAGKDVIADYTAGDTLKISSGEITKTACSKSDVIFTVGIGTLTVKNAKGMDITITDATGNTITQNYSGAVSGSSAMWFADDDTNFIGSGDGLDAISEVTPKDYSVAEISALENFGTAAKLSTTSRPAAEFCNGALTDTTKSR